MKTRLNELRDCLNVPSLVFTVIAWLLVSASGSEAASWQTCSGNTIRWNSSRANMFISTTSFPAGSSWDVRLQNAMWHWNNVKGAGFNFYVGRDTDGRHSRSNGVNEIYLSGSEVGSALAVTFKRYHCYWLFGYRYGIDETDIAFSSNRVWTTGSFNYGQLGSPYNFELVALHELGHALGLGHEDRGMATMNSYYPNSGPLGYYKEVDPNADDRLGVRNLYRDGTTETDVAGSAFKRTGTGTSSLVSSPTSARRGTNVTLEFSFANLSTAFQVFDIGFYLSTNSFISTSDIFLGRNNGASASSGAAGTFSRTLYIPTWIRPGTYYLGFLIDPNNMKGENNESNNNQPMPRTITIY